MLMRVLQFLLVASLGLLAVGVFQLSQNNGSSGLSCIILGLTCSLVLLLTDMRSPVRQQNSPEPAETTQS